MKIHDTEELDVDIRFLLANERTLLAWIRTSLAVEAGGIALIEIHKHHTYIGVSVLLFGAVVALIGYHRFVTANRAIRAHTLPPAGIGPALQVISIVAVAILLSIAQFTFLH
jgi:putative membrane protein